MAGKAARVAVEPSGSERDTMEAGRISDMEGKATREAVSGCGQRASIDGAEGISDMAGKAAMVAVEPSGSERDTMELRGSATWPVKPQW